MDVKAMTIAEEDQTRVWSSNQIFWGTFFGSYLCGFYLLSQNYKTLGYPQIAKKAIFGAISSGLIIISAYLFMSEALFEKIGFFLILGQGILAGGYLSYEHNKSFLNRNCYIQAMIFVPLLSFAVLTIPFYVSERLIAEIPMIMMFILPPALISGFAASHQEVHIKALMEEGTKKNSIGKLMGIALLAVLIQLGIVFAIVLLSLIFFPELDL